MVNTHKEGAGQVASEADSIRVGYKNIWFDIGITKKKLIAMANPFKDALLTPKGEIPIEIKKKVYKLFPGKPLVVPV